MTSVTWKVAYNCRLCVFVSILEKGHIFTCCADEVIIEFCALALFLEYNLTKPYAVTLMVLNHFCGIMAWLMSTIFRSLLKIQISMFVFTLYSQSTQPVMSMSSFQIVFQQFRIVLHVLLLKHSGPGHFLFAVCLLKCL